MSVRLGDPTVVATYVYMKHHTCAYTCTCAQPQYNFISPNFLPASPYPAFQTLLDAANCKSRLTEEITDLRLFSHRTIATNIRRIILRQMPLKHFAKTG